MMGEKASYNVKTRYKEMFSYFTHWSIYKQISSSVNKACVCVCVCVYVHACVCVVNLKKGSFATKNPLMLTRFHRTHRYIRLMCVYLAYRLLCPHVVKEILV